MMKAKEPFWEKSYRDTAAPSTFGKVSEEIRQILPRLTPDSDVLDIGCGDGRNALFLAEHGMVVTAIDISGNAIAKLQSRAAACIGRIRAEVMDVRNYVPDRKFDLIIAHGILHMLPRSDWAPLILKNKESTRPAGFNVAAVFTDLLPPPYDLELFMPGLFHEEELLAEYADWNVEFFKSYIKEDEHPGGVRHRHPVNKIIARKPI